MVEIGPIKRAESGPSRGNPTHSLLLFPSLCGLFHLHSTGMKRDKPAFLLSIRKQITVAPAACWEQTLTLRLQPWFRSSFGKLQSRRRISFAEYVVEEVEVRGDLDLQDNAGWVDRIREALILQNRFVYSHLNRLVTGNSEKSFCHSKNK